MVKNRVCKAAICIMVILIRIPDNYFNGYIVAFCLKCFTHCCRTNCKLQRIN